MQGSMRASVIVLAVVLSSAFAQVGLQLGLCCSNGRARSPFDFSVFNFCKPHGFQLIDRLRKGMPQDSSAICQC
jgi:hypothetical protein